MQNPCLRTRHGHTVATATLLLTSLTQTPAARAQESEWEFSAGANLRRPGTVSLKSFPLNAGAYIDGAIVDQGDGHLPARYRITVEDALKQVTPDAGQLQLVTVRTMGADGEKTLDTGAGIVVQARKPLGDYGEVSLAVVGSLTTASSDSRMRFSADERATTWSIAPDVWPGGVIPSGNPHQTDNLAMRAAPVDATALTGLVRADVDLRLCTAGLGLAADVRDWGRVQLGANVGLALNVATCKTTLTETVVWSDDGGAVSGRQESHRDRDAIPGCYLGLHVNVAVGNGVSLFLAGRYDHAFSDLDAGPAHVDLSAWSTQLGLRWAF